MKLSTAKLRFSCIKIQVNKIFVQAIKLVFGPWTLVTVNVKKT